MNLFFECSVEAKVIGKLLEKTDQSKRLAKAVTLRYKARNAIKKLRLKGMSKN